MSSPSVDNANEFLDLVYEAAIVPERWPGVLENISKIAGARGTILLTADAANLKWVASDAIRPDMIAFDEGNWHARNSRLPKLLAAQHAGFLREIDVYPSRQAIEEDYHIREFFRPRGLGWAAGTAIPVPSGDFLIYSIEREYQNGPVEDDVIHTLDSLRPSLARAALTSARLGLERAQAMAQALDMIGLPAAVLGRSGRLTAANPSFGALVPAIFLDRRDRVMLTEPTADGLLASGLAAVAANRLVSSVRSIPLPGRGGHPPAIIHLMPVCGAANDIFTQAQSLLIVTPVDRGAVPAAEVLQGLFDLTPAEARVARGIGEGKPVEAIAAAAGVSRETVRTQLKAVLAKTGTERQAELAALLAGTGLQRS